MHSTKQSAHKDAAKFLAFGEDKENWPYDGGMDDLEIEWLPVGTRFKINEYDGKESLETLDDLCFVA